LAPVAAAWVRGPVASWVEHQLCAGLLVGSPLGTCVPFWGVVDGGGLGGGSEMSTLLGPEGAGFGLGLLGHRGLPSFGGRGWSRAGWSPRVCGGGGRDRP